MQYIIYIYKCASFRVCVFVLQMVWAETHRVGCALHLCSTLQGLNWDRASFLVCNYYPASVLLLLLSLLRTTTTNINTLLPNTSEIPYQSSESFADFCLYHWKNNTAPVWTTADITAGLQRRLTRWPDVITTLYWSTLVCVRHPRGNYEGERPYVEGDWCSRCPENMQKCENNLCGERVKTFQLCIYIFQFGSLNKRESNDGWMDR